MKATAANAASPARLVTTDLAIPGPGRERKMDAARTGNARVVWSAPLVRAWTRFVLGRNIDGQRFAIWSDPWGRHARPRLRVGQPPIRGRRHEPTIAPPAARP